MSLTSWAVTVATVCALRGQTLAGDRVKDSPLDPIDLAISDLGAGAQAPLIAVYDDMGRVETAGRDLLQGTRTMHLTMQVFLPETLVVPGSTHKLKIREAGGAFAINFMYRQIERALLVQDSVWTGLWNRFVDNVHSVETRAYVLDTGKVQVPAREIVLKLDIMDSPDFGGGAPPIWDEFVAALAADPSYGLLAPAMTAALQGGEALPQWRIDAATLGYSVADMQLLGEAPLGGGPTDDVVPAIQATLCDEAPGVPDPEITIFDGIPATFEP